MLRPMTDENPVAHVVALETGDVQFTVPLGGGKVAALVMSPDHAVGFAVSFMREAERAEDIRAALVERRRTLN